MENQTLVIASALVALLCSAALFLNWAANRQVPGLLSIATGFLITSVGMVLLATQPTLDPAISIVGANIFLIGGRLPSLVGLAAFWNQEKSRLPLICGALFVATIGLVIYFTYVQDSPLGRIRSHSAMMLVISLCSLYVVVNGLKIERQLRPVMSISTNFGVYMLIVLFACHAAGDLLSMVSRPGLPLWESDLNTALLLLGSIAVFLLFTLGVILMTMDEKELEHMEDAIYDPITTILNHRTFLEVGQRVLGVALRYTKPVSMLTIEVANLDDVIRDFGVKVGNEMLRHFSLMATDRRRNEDVLARSSYKEFRMLLPGVDEAGAEVVIGKIKQALQAEEYIYRGKTLRVEVHIASITRREEDLHLQQMLQEGELELFRVKQAAAATEAS